MIMKQQQTETLHTQMTMLTDAYEQNECYQQHLRSQIDACKQLLDKNVEKQRQLVEFLTSSKQNRNIKRRNHSQMHCRNLDKRNDAAKRIKSFDMQHFYKIDSDSFATDDYNSNKNCLNHDCYLWKYPNEAFDCSNESFWQYLNDEQYGYVQHKQFFENTNSRPVVFHHNKCMFVCFCFIVFLFFFFFLYSYRWVFGYAQL